jgi:hypothetical protein
MPRKTKRAPAKKPRAKKSRKGVGGRPKKRWLKDYAAVGLPPADSLARVDWLGKVLSIALLKVLQDPGINEEARLTRIRQLTKDLKSLVPDERRWAAEQKILEFERQLSGPAPSAEGSEELSDASVGGKPGLVADSGRLGHGRSLRQPAARVPDGPDIEDAGPVPGSGGGPLGSE